MSKEEDLFKTKLSELLPKCKITPNWRPDKLKNAKTGKNLEIDCYVRWYRIGFEYQGGIHFRDVKEYRNDSDKSRYHDVKKYELLCDKENLNKRKTLTLIEIFPQDLKGNFKENIITRLVNHHDYYLKIGKYLDVANILRLLFHINTGVHYRIPKEKSKKQSPVIDLLYYKIKKLENTTRWSEIDIEKSKLESFYDYRYCINNSTTRII